MSDLRVCVCLVHNMYTTHRQRPIDYSRGDNGTDCNAGARTQCVRFAWEMTHCDGLQVIERWTKYFDVNHRCAPDYCELVICLYLQFRFAVKPGNGCSVCRRRRRCNDAIYRPPKYLCAPIVRCVKLHFELLLLSQQFAKTLAHAIPKCVSVCARRWWRWILLLFNGTHTPQPSIDQFQDQLDANIEHTHSSHIERSRCESIEFRPFEMPFIRLVFHRNAILWNLNSWFVSINRMSVHWTKSICLCRWLTDWRCMLQRIKRVKYSLMRMNNATMTFRIFAVAVTHSRPPPVVCTFYSFASVCCWLVRWAVNENARTDAIGVGRIRALAPATQPHMMTIQFSNVYHSLYGSLWSHFVSFHFVFFPCRRLFAAFATESDTVMLSQAIQFTDSPPCHSFGYVASCIVTIFENWKIKFQLCSSASVGSIFFFKLCPTMSSDLYRCCRSTRIVDCVCVGATGNTEFVSN